MENYFDAAARGWDADPMKVTRAKTTADRIKQITFHSNRSVVDFGCGTGLLGVHLKDIFDQVHLVDSSSEMLQVASEKIANAHIDNMSTHCIDQLSKLGQQVSAIATLMVLHHIDNTADFLAEAFDALESKGVLVIADLYKEDGSFHKHDASFSGHNGFDTDKLSVLAEQNGFVVESVEKYFDIWKENYQQQKVPYPVFLFVARKQR